MLTRLSTVRFSTTSPHQLLPRFQRPVTVLSSIRSPLSLYLKDNPWIWTSYPDDKNFYGKSFKHCVICNREFFSDSQWREMIESAASLQREEVEEVGDFRDCTETSKQIPYAIISRLFASRRGPIEPEQRGERFEDVGYVICIKDKDRVYSDSSQIPNELATEEKTVVEELEKFPAWSRMGKIDDVILKCSKDQGKHHFQQFLENTYRKKTEEIQRALEEKYSHYDGKLPAE